MHLKGWQADGCLSDSIWGWLKICLVAFYSTTPYPTSSLRQERIAETVFLFISKNGCWRIMRKKLSILNMKIRILNLSRLVQPQQTGKQMAACIHAHLQKPGWGTTVNYCMSASNFECVFVPHTSGKSTSKTRWNTDNCLHQTDTLPPRVQTEVGSRFN